MSPFHPTTFWHALPDGRVQCDVCPRECRLREGQAGHCFVRACHEGAVVLTTYGRSSGFCVDPMEKKPLNHFLPGTPVLSFGTAGCNLGCQFCQNWDISRSRETATLSSEASPELVALAAVETGSTAVAFTYNDPVIFLEYAVDTARACRERGIRAVAKTAGYINPEARREFFSVMDAASIDLKSFSEDFYRRITLGALQPVLDTILHVRHHTRAWLELTTLLIPGLNDSDEELHALTRWVATELGPDLPLHFSAFHPDHRMLDRPRTPTSTMQRARTLARANGLRHVYTGNVLDEDTSSTFCHGCGACVIGRRGYTLTSWSLTDSGHCTACGTRCPGVFDGPPGDWGSRRQPVDMEALAHRASTSARR
jgi:pyruvate formate lyase activating enzyme